MFALGLWLWPGSRAHGQGSYNIAAANQYVDYQRASALGDQLGAGNYSRLPQAIAASQQSRSEDPL